MLSPRFGRCVFLFQRYRVGGGSRRYRDAASLRDWLASMLADGGGILRRRLSLPRTPGGDGRVTMRRWQASRSLRGFVPSRERQLETSAQAARFIELRRRMELRWAGPDDFLLQARDRVSRRGRSGQRRACDSARAHHARLPARADLELDSPARAYSLGAKPISQRVLALLEAVSSSRLQSGALDASLRRSRHATFRADLASMRTRRSTRDMFRS